MRGYKRARAFHGKMITYRRGAAGSLQNRQWERFMNKFRERFEQLRPVYKSHRVINSIEDAGFVSARFIFVPEGHVSSLATLSRNAATRSRMLLPRMNMRDPYADGFDVFLHTQNKGFGTVMFTADTETDFYKANKNIEMDAESFKIYGAPPARSPEALAVAHQNQARNGNSRRNLFGPYEDDEDDYDTDEYVIPAHGPRLKRNRNLFGEYLEGVGDEGYEFGHEDYVITARGTE